MPTSKSVFLLEYDNTLRDLIRLSLLRCGFEVCAEKNAAAFVERTSTAHPDLFLVDLFIPGVDSLEFIRSLKQNDRIRDIPLIVLSVYGFEEIIVQTIKLGAVDFILKPFDMDLFLEKVKRVVNLQAGNPE